MGTLSGEATLLFSFLCHLGIRCQLLKKRVCSPWSNFFSLRGDPIFGRLRNPGKQTGSQKKNCLPLKTSSENMAEKDGDVPNIKYISVTKIRINNQNQSESMN